VRAALLWRLSRKSRISRRKKLNDPSRDSTRKVHSRCNLIASPTRRSRVSRRGGEILRFSSRRDSRSLFVPRPPSLSRNFFRSQSRPATRYAALTQFLFLGLHGESPFRLFMGRGEKKNRERERERGKEEKTEKKKRNARPSARIMRRIMQIPRAA